MKKSVLYKGILEPIILNLFATHTRMYGYDITQKVRHLTKGEIVITEGALYPLLHKLEAEGVLESEVESIGNRMRKYYFLTSKGKKQKNIALQQLQGFVETLQILLKPQNV